MKFLTFIWFWFVAVSVNGLPQYYPGIYDYGGCAQNALAAYQNAINNYYLQYQAVIMNVYTASTWDTANANAYITAQQTYLTQLQDQLTVSVTQLQDSIIQCY
jgi:hypothetical protein